MKILKEVTFLFTNLITSLIVFFLMFLFFLNIIPNPESYLSIMLNSYKAGHWNETPCLIISSKVSSEERIKSKSHGDSIKYNIYYPDIVYSYKVNNIDYKSSQYSFFYFLSEDEVNTIIKDYPPGKKTVCYVNPSRQEESVLNPETPYKVFNRIIKEDPVIYDIMLILIFFPVIMNIMALIMRKTMFRNVDFDKTSGLSILMDILRNKQNKK